MDLTTDAGHSAGHYHDDAPFAEERDRYLRHCAECGATPFSLRTKRSELLWIATRLGPDASSEGIDIEALRRIAIERQQAHGPSPRREEWSISDDLGFDFSAGGGNRVPDSNIRANSTSM
ncbi:hypothetical protein MPL1032_180107 [Mesorhizobium plurifarium]|uniref:Uncharacterized protein n=1 Tax=Mesorhizobium plurifarium TaxID=69974 RepID=A0A0K2VTM3_MESPL|nr:hypothetical protein MPL1032_180107 [Mesorhizobium plurifarium]